MPDERLRRAARHATEDPINRPRLHGVVQRRSRPVQVHVGDVLRRDRGVIQGRTHRGLGAPPVGLGSGHVIGLTRRARAEELHALLPLHQEEDRGAFAERQTPPIDAERIARCGGDRLQCREAARREPAERVGAPRHHRITDTEREE